MKSYILLLSIFLINYAAKSQWIITDTLQTSPQCTIPIPYKANVEFVSEDTAYYFYNTLACSPGSGNYTSHTLFRTVDGFSNWNILLHTYAPGDNSIKKLKFINNNVGFIITAYQINWSLRKTLDAGATWNTISTITGNEKIIDFFFFNSDSGYVITGNGFLFKCINDSIYQNDTIFTNSYGPNLYFTSSNYYILSRGGFPNYYYDKLLLSNDNGNTWITSFHNPLRNLMDISFCTDSIGYLASDTGIYKTTDAGNTWNLLNTSFSYCTNISILNCNEIYAIGSQNFTKKLFKSNNGGLTWNEEILPANIEPDKIKMINKNIGFIHGNYGNHSLYNNIILKTTTGGTNPAPDTNVVSEIKIYPNPTNGFFSINCSDCLNGSIELFDLMGKSIFSTRIREEKIEIYTNLISGIYFVKIKTSNQNFVKKLIVEN